jgi:hypothetical protein
MRPPLSPLPPRLLGAALSLLLAASPAFSANTTGGRSNTGSGANSGQAGGVVGAQTGGVTPLGVSLVPSLSPALSPSLVSPAPNLSLTPSQLLSSPLAVQEAAARLRTAAPVGLAPAPGGSELRPALPAAPSAAFRSLNPHTLPAPADGPDANRPGSIDIAGAAVSGANALGRGLGDAARAGAPAGASLDVAFDGAGARVNEAPLSAASLLADAPGARVALAPKEAERLGKLSQEVAALRAQRASQGEASLSQQDAAVLRGIDELARAVALGDSTQRQIDESVRVVESMDVETLRRFSAAAKTFLNTDVQGKSSPFARVGNVEHVEQQLIEPLVEDGPELARAFKTNPRQSADHFVETLRALQYATDLGKQQNPDDMGAALARFNSQADTGPNWYINNFILPHEYASMILVESLGKQAGMSRREVAAFQRLIANHNFGPDLTDKKNAAMREHWWPKSFRSNTLPMLKAMGIDVARHFKADETGTLQYGHALRHPLTMLLSVYDRAIAVSQSKHRTGNGSGLATWKKYGIQDFNGKKGRLTGLRQRNAAKKPGELLEPEPLGAKDEDGKAGPIFEFDGPSVIKAMESAADWAEQHVESLWGSLRQALPEGSAAARDWRNFGPFLNQRKAIGFLNGLLRVVKASNPEGPTNRADVLPGDGVAYYEARSNELAGVYRVSLERKGPGAFDPRSTDFTYSARVDRWQDGGWKPIPEGGAFAGNQALAAAVPGKIATAGVDPVVLFIDLVRADQDKLTAEAAAVPTRGPPSAVNIFAPAPQAPAPKADPKDVAAARRYIADIGSGVKLSARQTEALFGQWLEEEGISPSSTRARLTKQALLPEAAAAETALLDQVHPSLRRRHGQTILRLAREEGKTPAEVSGLIERSGNLDLLAPLDVPTFETQAGMVLRRAELEAAVAGYPDNAQGDFLRGLAGHMAAPGGKSIEEVTRDGVFAYVDFSGSAGVLRAYTGRDPDVQSAQVVYYITRRDGKWQLDVYRQNRRTGRADSSLTAGLRDWLMKGGIPEEDFAP